MQKRLLALYSCGHFLVDMACAYLMLSVVANAENTPLAFLLYNFGAFALQMPVGLLVDRWRHSVTVSISGFVLICLAFALFTVPLICAIVLGIGNCLYHIGGGVEVLHFDSKKQWMLGVFVSPGAIGLFVGGWLAGQLMLIHGFFLFLFMAGLIISGLYFTYRTKELFCLSPPSILPTGRRPLLALISLFLVVVLRSYAGLTQVFTWKAGVWVPLAVLGLACGKAMGGILADRFSPLRVSVVTLSLSTIFYLFSNHAVCGLLALFLFNMTMPLTLFAMAQLFPGARGFAFGTLTFALFLGYIPTALSLPVPFAFSTWWYAAETVISLLFLIVGLLAARQKAGDTHA